MSLERKGLNTDVLKNGLTHGDFGREIDNIDSIDQLEDVVTPIETPQVEETLTGVNFIEDEPVETSILTDQNITPETPQETVIPEQNSTKDLLKIFGSNLNDLGLIKFSEEEFDKAEDKDEFFKDQISKSIQEGIKSGIELEKSEWPERIAEMIELEKKGVPAYKILEADRNIASLEEIKPQDIESSIDLQKNILKELYNLQEFPQDKIEAKIKRAEDLGTLKDDSIEGFDILLNFEKKEKENMIKAEQAKYQETENNRKAKLKEIENTIMTSTEIIPGFPLTDEDKKTMVNGITKIIGKDKNGRPINALTKARMDDPSLELKQAYFSLVLKGKLPSPQKSTETKVTRSLSAAVKSTDPLSQGIQVKPNDVNRPDTKEQISIMRNSLRALQR